MSITLLKKIKRNPSELANLQKYKEISTDNSFFDSDISRKFGECV